MPATVTWFLSWALVPALLSSSIPRAAAAETRPGGAATVIAAQTTCRKARATVAVRWDGPSLAAAVGLGLHYPGDKLELPGSGNDETVRARVENISGVTSGLFERVDLREPSPDGDAPRDNRINAGLVVVPAAIRPGEIVRVEFDCRSDEELPRESEFSCSAEVGDQSGQQLVHPSCSVALALTP